MKKHIFILISIFSHAFLHSADKPQRKFSVGGLHHVDICMEKIDRIIDQVQTALEDKTEKSDTFNAEIITYIAIATIDSESPRIHAISEPIAQSTAKELVLNAFATLKAKSYHETSPHEQSRRLYNAARQYKAATESLGISR